MNQGNLKEQREPISLPAHIRGALHHLLPLTPTRELLITAYPVAWEEQGAGTPELYTTAPVPSRALLGVGWASD